MNTGMGATASTARTAATIPRPAAAASSGLRQFGLRRASRALDLGLRIRFELSDAQGKSVATVRADSTFILR